MDIATYNADWLAAWTAKDVSALLGFYAEDCRFFDPQNASGLTGHAELKPYLEQLFATTPPMTYTPDATWPITGGFCGRWYCQIEAGDRLRGFDMVLLDGDRITHNEVYLHQLQPA